MPAPALAIGARVASSNLGRQIAGRSLSTAAQTATPPRMETILRQRRAAAQTTGDTATPQPATTPLAPRATRSTASMSQVSSPSGVMNQLRYLRDVARQRQSDSAPAGADTLDQATELVGKQTTASILTSLWGAVWLDWTLLTLLGLNAYFVATWFTDKIAGFGEDYIFGKALPQGLAKWLEIILLGLLDMVIVGIILLIVGAGYCWHTMGWIDTLRVIWGGPESILRICTQK